MLCVACCVLLDMCCLVRAACCLLLGVCCLLFSVRSVPVLFVVCEPSVVVGSRCLTTYCATLAVQYNS